MTMIKPAVLCMKENRSNTNLKVMPYLFVKLVYYVHKLNIWYWRSNCELYILSAYNYNYYNGKKSFYEKHLRET